MKIEINPIGYVDSDYANTKDIPFTGVRSIIHINPIYKEGLKHLEKNSHLWILSWLHKADRTRLISTPRKSSDTGESYGVFSLRSPNRPNPIALSLVELEEINGNTLTVSGLDVIHGTPVVDIKPYFEKDSIFAPETPFIRNHQDKFRRIGFEKLALNHHGEFCKDLEIAVDMAMKVEMEIGNLMDKDLILEIEGSFCLLESLQGITRAKFSEPRRLYFTESKPPYKVIWKKGSLEVIT